MKRICDYPDNLGLTGLRVKGLKTGRIGTVLPQSIEVRILRDIYWNVL